MLGPKAILLKFVWRWLELDLGEGGQPLNKKGLGVPKAYVYSEDALGAVGRQGSS